MDKLGCDRNWKKQLCWGTFLVQVNFHLPPFPPVRPLQIQHNGEGLDPNGLGDPNPLGGLLPAINQSNKSKNHPGLDTSQRAKKNKAAHEVDGSSTAVVAPGRADWYRGGVAYLPLKASISLKLVPKRWLSKVLFPGSGAEQPSAQRFRIQ